MGQKSQSVKTEQVRTLLPLSILQVHITERCNKKCIHCYQSDAKGIADELTTEQWISVISRFQDLCRVRKWRGQVTFAGGEPFIRRDFSVLVREMKRWPDLRFAILTNGTYFDDSVALELKQSNPVFVQISIEGSPDAHDQIRGKGDFARCLNVISILKKAGLRTLVSFTAHRANYREFPVVADYVRQAGAGALWADRLVPMGRGNQLETLSPSETRAFFKLMYSERCTGNACSSTKIAMHRSLQFLCGGEMPYHCSAGKRLLAILPDGTVYPCRRLPIAIGNVLTKPLAQIYDEGKSICVAPEECKDCEHSMKCNGGARCIAYSVYGNLSKADPGCWLAHRPNSPDSPLCRFNEKFTSNTNGPNTN